MNHGARSPLWLLSSSLVKSHDGGIMEDLVPKSLERVYNSRNAGST
jgi:hypothetical protein